MFLPIHFVSSNEKNNAIRTWCWLFWRCLYISPLIRPFLNHLLLLLSLSNYSHSAPCHEHNKFSFLYHSCSSSALILLWVCFCILILVFPYQLCIYYNLLVISRPFVASILQSYYPLCHVEESLFQVILHLGKVLAIES